MTPGERRRKWLNKRARKRKPLARPLPLRETFLNAGGVTMSASRTERNVERAADLTDVLYLCEVANIDVADLLGPAWSVAQNTTNAAKAGCAIAIRRSRGYIDHWHLRLLVPAVLNGRRADRMRDRYSLRAVMVVDPGHPNKWRHTGAVAHHPPKRNWWPFGDVAMRVTRTIRAQSIWADWNRLKAYVKPRVGKRKVRMVRIDGLALRRWIPASKAKAFEVGSDHPAVRVVLWPKRKKKP